MARAPKQDGVIWGTHGNLGILESPIPSWYSRSEPITEAERAYAIRIIGKRWPYYPRELYRNVLTASLALGVPIVRVVTSLVTWRNRDGQRFYDGPPSHKKFTIPLRIALERAILDSPGCTPEEVLAKIDWEFISICTMKLYENYGFAFTQVRSREGGKHKGLNIRITELPIVGLENLSHIKESVEALERSQDYCYNPELMIAGEPSSSRSLPLFGGLEDQQKREAQNRLEAQKKLKAEEEREVERKQKAERKRIATEKLAEKRLTPSEADPVIVQQSSAAREQPEIIKPEISQELVDRIAEALRPEDESSRLLKEEVKKAIVNSLVTFDEAMNDVNNIMLYYKKNLQKILSALEKATYPKNPPKA